ncbi:MAG: hypothetical protein ACI4P4_14465 [Faecousia sp.]
MAEKKTDYGAQAVKDLQYRQRQKQKRNIPELPKAPGNGLYSDQQQAAPMGMDAPMAQCPVVPTDRFGQGVQRQMAEPEREIIGVGFDDGKKQEIAEAYSTAAVDSSTLMEFTRTLHKYRSSKASIEQRVKDAERWWKMRNSYMAATMTDGEQTQEGGRAPASGFQAKTAWLHNVITSKHADAVEAYPRPNILPREEGDKLEAWALSRIVPVVLKQNNFEKTYSDAEWQKLKTGTAVYKVVWDAEKLNGLGDISINRVDLLNIFWEPDINDIQDSRYVFHTQSEEKEELLEKYPELLKDRYLTSVITPAKFPGDDGSDTSNKVEVVDVYYKRRQGGRTVLHYCKYVGDTVLYATENDPERRDKGLYDHGKYPFVFDCLFPIERCPAGYGYVDICANPQVRIDLMNTAMLKNSLCGAVPRYFQRVDGAINEEEFLDLNNTIVHVNGNLGEDSIRVIDYKPLNGNYINLLNSAIDELRETSSNTETSTGSSTNGVTAASALAALQEASGKTSRDSTRATYRAYTDIVYMVIELIRQFYNMPRQFRITGNMGVQRFISFTNAGMQPQPQGMIGGVDLGVRTPIYDIDVVPEKRSSYTRIAQNEMAIQLYSLGMFNPQMTDQALVCLNMMDFDGKDELMQQITQNGTMFQQLQLYKAMAATLAAKYDPQLTGGLLNGGQQPQPKRDGAGKKPDLDKGSGEASHVTKAREQAQTAAQPGGGGA